MKVQQAQQDPLIQMQQMELQLKQEDNKRKTQKDMLDMAAKADQIRVEEERIASQERIAQAQLTAKNKRRSLLFLQTVTQRPTSSIGNCVGNYEG